MPVMSKSEHSRLTDELSTRFNALLEKVKSRELCNSCEGLKRSTWKRPETMCATNGNASEIRIAVADFGAILTEMKKLK